MDPNNFPEEDARRYLLQRGIYEEIYSKLDLPDAIKFLHVLGIYGEQIPITYTNPIDGIPITFSGINEITMRVYRSIKDHGIFNTLYWAATNGLMNFLKILVQGGADVNMTNTQGINALQIAIQKNRIKVVAYLLKHGAHADFPIGEDNFLLIDAIISNRKEIVDLLLQAGANPRREAWGFTPLMAAAQSGNNKLVEKFLLINDINRRTYQGTALSIAWHYNHPDIANILVKAGATH